MDEWITYDSMSQATTPGSWDSSQLVLGVTGYVQMIAAMF